MKRNNSIRMALCLVALLSLHQTAYGQDSVIDKSLKSYKMPPDILQYFQDKYKNQIEEFKCNFQESPSGPKGSLFIQGHIQIKKQGDIFGNGDSRIKTIAESFLREEATVLGLADLNEWRAADIHYSSRGASIVYYRYIQNISFVTCDSTGCHPRISLEIANDDSIRSLVTDFTPVSSDIYRAASKKTITEEGASKIVERELNATKINFSKIEMKKTIIDKPPYVVWTSYGRQGQRFWRYDLNAFTGELVFKENGVIGSE